MNPHKSHTGQSMSDNASKNKVNSRKITVRPVETEGDLKLFYKVPFEIYKDIPQWVPPFWFEFKEFFDKRNPFWKHAKYRMFLVYSNHILCGRIAAVIDDLYCKTYQEKTGFFGFAIPSDTILKELQEIITIGSYSGHSWLGISGIDMTYEIAQAIDVDVTYGWLITYVAVDSSAGLAGLQGGDQQRLIVDNYVIIGGDIIIAIDGDRVINGDALMSYLESDTSPGQVITLTIVRANTILNVPVELGSRPVVS